MISVANARGILRIWISKSIPPCRACGSKPDIHWQDLYSDGGELHAFCHGSHEFVAVDVADVVGRSLSSSAAVNRLIEVIEPWLGNLFAVDALVAANPDVRELIRYNKKPWRLTP